MLIQLVDKMSKLYQKERSLELLAQTRLEVSSIMAPILPKCTLRRGTGQPTEKPVPD